MDRKALGKGIDALFSDSSKTILSVTSTERKAEISAPLVGGRAVISLSLEKIVANKRQPRSYFDQEKLLELAESIKEHGVAEPVIVRAIEDGFFELIAGERRVRASKLAGKSDVPAIIKAFSDEQALELAIIENIQREDLSALEEAEAYLALMKEFGFTQEQVAKKLGKSRSAIANTLRLLELQEVIKLSLAQGEISAGHARALLAIEDESQRLAIWEKIKKDNLTVRDVEQLAAECKKKPAKVAVTPQLSTELAELETALSSLFSTKVKISGNAQKGKLEIHYFSREDLDRLLECFKNENNL